jgi:hypothetical protein
VCVMCVVYVSIASLHMGWYPAYAGGRSLHEEALHAAAPAPA